MTKANDDELAFLVRAQARDARTTQWQLAGTISYEEMCDLELAREAKLDSDAQTFTTSVLNFPASIQCCTRSIVPWTCGPA
jgi:hypothetical protein